jgi:hypothetical protein
VVPAPAGSAEPPLIAFRDSVKTTSARLDAALMKARRNLPVSVPPPHPDIVPVHWSPLGKLKERMSVGLNYPIPWNAYGYYFGGGDPPGSDSKLDHWTTNLRRNLAELRRELDIRVVRIFLLCNASNYGVFLGGGRTFQPHRSCIRNSPNICV